LGAGGDDTGAVGQGLHQAVGDSHQAAWLGREGGFACLIGNRPIAE